LLQTALIEIKPRPRRSARAGSPEPGMPAGVAPGDRRDWQARHACEAAIQLGLRAPLQRDTGLRCPVHLAIRLDDQAQFDPTAYVRTALPGSTSAPDGTLVHGRAVCNLARVPAR
jgi:hypothetical protein